MEEHDVPQVSGQPDVTAGERAIAVDAQVATAVAEALGDAECACGRPGGSCVCGAEDPLSPSGRLDPSYVYAIGRVDPRFPTLAADKEFAQAAGRAETAGLTDRQVLHDILSQRENRYLARQLCYVLAVEGIDTYVLQPRDPGDFDLLIDAVRAGSDLRRPGRGRRHERPDRAA